MTVETKLINIMKTYRDLTYAEVEAYADQHQLNIETHENYREAAQACFADLPKIDFTRIKNDINGNPRYVCHFLTLITDKDKIKTDNAPFSYLSQDLYNLALKRAKTIGGRKYNTKTYVGGIVFQSYNIADLKQSIIDLTK